MITVDSNKLIGGDPLDPSSTDLIVQIGRIDVGEPVPDGWRVLTGNNDSSLVARVIFRFEADSEGNSE
jgi:hypothetical protein